jgi:hypothetical protein
VSRHKGAAYEISAVDDGVVEQLVVQRSKHMSISKDEVGPPPSDEDQSGKEIDA